MATTVKLSAILEALDMMMDEWSAHLDKRTGEVHTLPDEAFELAEEDDDEEDGLENRYTDCCEEDIAMARDIIDHRDQYLALPTQFDLDEYRIMQDFAYSRPEESVADELARAIQGRGAFRYFKDTIHRLGIQEEWFRYRDAAIKRYVVDWCEVNDVKYTDE